MHVSQSRSLGGKFPFAHMCDISDAFNTFSDDGGDEFLGVTLKLPMVGTTTIISKSDMENMHTSGTFTTIRNFWSALLYFLLAFYYFNRIKRIFKTT